MAALTTVRDTKLKGPPKRMFDYAMALSTTIYQGAMVGLNAAGLLVPMAGAVATLKCVGRAEETKVSAASGTTYCKVYAGSFKWTNSATNVVAAGNRGALVYAEDDQTVGNVAGTNSVAGTVEEVVSDGVWVNIDHIGRL